MTILTSLRENIKKHFILNFDTIFEHLDLPDKNGKTDGRVDTLDEIRRLMFTDIMGHDKKAYEEVRDWPKLQASIENSLKSYA